MVNEIKEKLATDDRWLIRGILAIYANQTADEQRVDAVNHNNGVGFTSYDAALLSSFAKQILRWKIDQKYKNPLTETQMAIARKKMAKYARQLARIAKEKAARRDEAAA